MTRTLRFNLLRKGARRCAPTLLLVFSACSKYYYNPSSQILPQHIRELAIRPFSSHTQQFRIEDKLTLAVQSLFNQDGRYQITSEEEADGVLIGDINKYI